MRARPTRRRFAWLAAVAMLSAQVVVAGYDCPPLGAVKPAMAQDCGAMDATQPSLCKAHSDAQHQLGDTHSTSASPAVSIVTLALLPAPLRLPDRAGASRIDSYFLSRLIDGSPPLFLRLQVLLT